MDIIRQAVAADASEIANLLSGASFVHRHLDWTPLLDWINSFPFLVSERNSKLTGVFACPPDPPGVAWVKCFACRDHAELKEYFKSFLGKIKDNKLLTTGCLYALGMQDWFIELLKTNQFADFQKVVVLEHYENVKSDTTVNQALVRPMELADIPRVAELDRMAFEPIWVISPQAMKLAFLQSAHSLVIELDGKLIGYELSTSTGSSAHLARVAVHPDHQNENLASTLVNEMITYFHRNRIFFITVNTQKENRQSLALYRKMGFRLTGEQYPIYRLEI